MPLTQKHNQRASQNPAAHKKPNRKIFRKATQTITGFARIATLITAAAAIIPANAQALVASGDFGKTVKRTIHKGKGKAHSTARSSSGRNPAGRNTEAAIIAASLGGMARSVPMGIYTASPNIVTSCFRPRLVGLLASIQHKYHRPVIITSGYRGAVHNIRAGGVRGSLHVACAAADIKVPGVNKYQLAAFVRSLPNRGGVGLYCHQAVHVDIGTPRDWNWCGTRRR